MAKQTVSGYFNSDPKLNYRGISHSRMDNLTEAVFCIAIKVIMASVTSGMVYGLYVPVIFYWRISFRRNLDPLNDQNI